MRDKQSGKSQEKRVKKPLDQFKFFFPRKHLTSSKSYALLSPRKAKRDKEKTRARKNLLTKALNLVNLLFKNRLFFYKLIEAKLRTCPKYLFFLGIPEVGGR